MVNYLYYYYETNNHGINIYPPSCIWWHSYLKIKLKRGHFLDKELIEFQNYFKHFVSIIIDTQSVKSTQGYFVIDKMFPTFTSFDAFLIFTLQLYLQYLKIDIKRGCSLFKFHYFFFACIYITTVTILIVFLIYHDNF